MKLIRPKSLAFYTGVVALALYSSFILLLFRDDLILYQVVLVITAGILVFTASYLVVLRLLNRYFYSNLRIVYNNIQQLSSPHTKSINRPVTDAKLLDEINKLLIDWEKDSQEEIDHLKELENYRKEFLGNISHELKTPLFTVQGYIHTLLDGGIEDHDINLLYLKKAAKGIDRLNSIVYDLESISKLEAGELILENRTFDIMELCTDVIESLELKAGEYDVKLQLEDSSGKPLYVYADKDRIRQVVLNLLDNSIKYGRSPGKTIISVDEHTDHITVDIRDDGIGIEKQHLSRLFERFYRIDKSRSREQGGTGLGLAIVKHIIEAHDQNITVSSEAGKGTTFTFTLKKSK